MYWHCTMYDATVVDTIENILYSWHGGVGVERASTIQTRRKPRVGGEGSGEETSTWQNSTQCNSIWWTRLWIRNTERASDSRKVCVYVCARVCVCMAMCVDGCAWVGECVFDKERIRSVLVLVTGYLSHVRCSDFNSELLLQVFQLNCSWYMWRLYLQPRLNRNTLIQSRIQISMSHSTLEF